ncbi:hypothetical protein RQP46_009075 [Phenoliferia psychrophenolica]
MTSSLAAAEAPWTATTAVDPLSSSAELSSSDSDSDSVTLADPIVEYDSTHGFQLPLKGEGYTTRKGKDYRAKSTWFLKSFSQRTWSERILGLLYRPEMESQYYITDVERGPIPKGNLLADNAFILFSGLSPIALQSAAYWTYPGFKWPLWLALAVYSTCFLAFAVTLVYRFNRDVLKHGVFDEKNFGRDRLADTGVFTVLRGISATISFRTGLSFLMGYNPDHPTILHAILADGAQELSEIVLVPSFTCNLIPMSHAELWLTLTYIFYVEVGGHTGVRIHLAHPVVWFLKIFSMDLCLEDHDLHHRNGKSGLCYGKQTRVWDRLFGTVGDRIETAGM